MERPIFTWGLESGHGTPKSFQTLTLTAFEPGEGAWGLTVAFRETGEMVWLRPPNRPRLSSIARLWGRFELYGLRSGGDPVGRILPQHRAQPVASGRRLQSHLQG